MPTTKPEVEWSWFGVWQFSLHESRYRDKIWNMGVSKTNHHIQIKIMMPSPSQEHWTSSEAPNQDSKDMDVIHTFKITIKRQNSEHRCIKDHWPCQNQDQDQTRVRNLQHPPEPHMRTESTWIFFAHSKSGYRVIILKMGVSKTCNHIQMKIKIPNSS